MPSTQRKVPRRFFVQCAAAGVLAGCWPSTDDRAREVARGRSRIAASGDKVTLFLCGDVMTARGIDQVLRRPSRPRIYEPAVKDAREYVELAMAKNGPIPAPVDDAYVWGDALAELDRVEPHARIINLETAVTKSEDREPKGINYRMHPENVGCILAAGIDCCVLANNHALDWGRAGLVETMSTLRHAGLATAGAGSDLAEASAPAMIGRAGSRRVAVFGFAVASAGVPREWAARANRPGVSLLHDVSSRTVDAIAAQVEAATSVGDIVVASIHWGPNWGYEIPSRQRELAHQLVDRAGVDVVHGHSSHHPKAIEVYGGKPILYGCGDLINDYEGIGGQEQYRGDLALMYFVTLDSGSGKLASLQMTPLQIHRFRLRHARPTDVRWLRKRLDREARRFGASVEETESGLAVRW